MLDMETLKEKCEEFQSSENGLLVSYGELLSNINDTLKPVLEKIDDTDEFFINYDEYFTVDNLEGKGWGIYNNEVEIVRTAYNDNKEKMIVEEKLTGEQLKSEDIRFMIDQLPEFIEYLHKKIDEKVSKNKKAINKIQNMIDGIIKN